MSERDRRAIERQFDQIGDLEWLRFREDLASEVSFEMHRRFLRRFVTAGARVLDMGAGPGRFTIELAEIGASVLVADISSVQLELNRRHVSDAGVVGSVRGWEQLDVCDLGAIEDGTFDVVLAYGGVVSYAFDEASTAVSELLRVVRPGGYVVGSVMSLAGSARRYLASFPAAIEALGVSAFSDFLNDGDQRRLAALGAHECRLFTYAQLAALIRQSGGEITAASASNWLALAEPDAVKTFADSPEVWRSFLDWEERMCGEQGAVDGGTHLLFAARHADS